MAVVGKLSDARPATVRGSGKLRIYIQANIHAGEVEGKESAQALVRDLAMGRHAEWLERLSQPAKLQLEEFRIETDQAAERAFERHQERTVTGKYAAVERTLPAGTYRVPMNQPLARLAFYVLEPRSSDGLLTWNFFDDALKNSKVFPIVRSRP